MGKKIILFFLLALTASANGQITKLWEKSAVGSNLPAWFDTGNLTRGFAYGEVEGNDRLFVVSRNGGNFIYIIDAANGDSLGILDPTGIAGGTYNISDVAVSDDGVIFVCNLSINGNIKVYSWENEVSTPTPVIDEALTGRYGDKFSISGSLSDNSVVLWFASANSNDLVKFTTSDNGATFASEIVDIGVMGGSASVGPLSDGSFYYNSTGQNPKKFSSDVSLLGTMDGSIVATGSNSIRYITTNYGNEYIITFQYGLGNENARIVKVADGDVLNSSTFDLTSSMQVNSNANGTGDVAVKDKGDGTYDLYVLSTNNGMQAYQFMPDPMDNASNWSLSDENIPTYFGANTERGMAYSKGKVYVVSRNGPDHRIFVHNAATGELTDTIAAPPERLGLFPVNCVETTDEGDVLLCNMTLNANEGAPFAVYKWNSTDTKWDTLVIYEGGGRIGDMLSAYGNISDNSITIYAAAANTDKLVKFTTADNGVTFTAEEVTLTNLTLGTVPNVAEADDGTIYVKTFGKPLIHFNSDGTLIDTVSSGVVATGATKVVYKSSDEGEILLTYLPDIGGSGDLEKVAVVDLTAAGPVLAGYTPSLGSIANGNGTGSVGVYTAGDGSIILYVMGSNNGLAAYEESDIVIYDPLGEFAPWSLTEENIPTYFGANTERGMAYSEGKVYVVSRNGPDHRIFVHNAVSGELTDTIAAPPERLGLFPVNCVETTDEGDVLLCNMTLNANEGAPFAVYKWNSTDTKWDTLVIYEGGGRIGDMLSAYGNISDNSITIYAAAANTDKLVKFTTADNGVTFTAEEVTLTNLTLGTVPNVAEADDGTIYVKTFGKPLIHFNSDGTLIDTVSSGVVATGATKVVYKSSDEGEILLTYLPDIGGSGDLEKVAVVDLTAAGPVLAGYTPSLGSIANGNGTGSVDVHIGADGSVILFVMGSNNGVAAYYGTDISLPVLAINELYEDFEEDWLPEGWITFAANISAGDPTEPWKQSSYKPYTGSSHAYMNNYSTVSDCYLVTPPLNLNGELSAFRFFVQDDWNLPDYDFGSVLKIMASTNSQDNPEDFVVIDSVKESDCYDIVLNKIIDLKAIEGDYAYIAFMVTNFGDPDDANAGGDNWVIDQVSLDSLFTDVSKEDYIPKSYSLVQNYPNPFNPSTKISFSLKVSAKVELTIYNILGQEVATLVKKDLLAGTHSINFDAHNLASGMYIYRINATGVDGSEFVDLKKMMLLK